MWNKTKSLILSRILVYSFLIMLIAALACVPIISRWYDAISAGTGFIHGSAFVPVCIMLYICDILALCAVNALRILLNNIARTRFSAKAIHAVCV